MSDASPVKELEVSTVSNKSEVSKTTRVVFGAFVLLAVLYILYTYTNVFSGMLPQKMAGGGGQNIKGYYVVDTDLLMKAGVNTVINESGGLSKESVEAANKLAITINKEVKSLGDQGYLILQKNAVIANPSSIDLTPYLAKKAGIDLNAKDAIGISKTGPAKTEGTEAIPKGNAIPNPPDVK